MAEKTQYDRVKEITDQLEAGIENLFNSDQYKQWLTTMSRFHDYSLNNTLLIAMQKPDATLVAGYTTWKNQFGRQVNKGEKGIRILAPTPYKKKVEVDKTDPNTGEILKNPDGSNQKEIQEVLRPAFKVVSVFDVSQTDGRELPSLGVNELTGDVEQYEMFFEALKRTCPVPMEFEQISSGAKGYYHQIEQRIAIQEGMSQIQTVKTAIHEMAHQKLHAIDPNLKKSQQNLENISRGGKEVEAESVAYTVCQHYGIDTSDYSFAYIAGWSKGKETPELKASLDTIRKAASEMINDIDGHMKLLHQEKEQENTQDSKQVEAAYQIGNHYLEIHEASDGSWDYTLYGHNFREVDGGQISDSDTMTIEVAAKEVADFYQLYNQKLEPMDRDKLADLTELYNPVFTDEQIHFMAEIIDQGFDPKEYWVGGKAMDLTEKRLFAEDIADIKYQV
ncbi:MAG: LPD16 domain-containing protein [Faecalimonas umbilicata]|uniref:LPD16 domain-containing protein n=1 Tax=Faecalimonas umbilicata TaxID=1912855 RepID=UPI00300EC333